MAFRSQIRAHTILLALILLAFTLRMVRVGELRMWGDEAFSVYSANRSLAAITFEGAENDPHPPLYYYLLHLYLPLAGASELAVRFFSVFPGTATVALVYAIAKRLYDARTGRIAAALAAIAPFGVYYSQEIRMYALAAFLTTLALYFFARLLDTHGFLAERRGAPPPSRAGSDRKLWIAYALTMFLALYSLYHAAFVFLAQGIFLLCFWRTARRFVLRWFAISIGVVVLFLPWLLFRFSSTLGHLEDRAGHTALTLPVFAARGLAALAAGPTISPTPALFFTAALAALVLVALARTLKLHRTTAGNGLVFALTIVPILAVYPLYLLLPIFVARLFALALVPLLLLLAYSLSHLDRRVAIPFAVAILAMSTYSLNDYYWHFDRYNAAAEDYIPVVRSVEQDAQAGDVVLFHAYWQIGYFLSHYRGAPVQYLALDRQADLDAAVAQPRTVWAVMQGPLPHGSEVWLARHTFPIGELKYGQMRLISYRVATPESGETFATPVLFSNGMTLLGYRMNRAPLESGRGLATIELDWQAAHLIADDYVVSVRLTTASATDSRPLIWAQEDKQPADGTLRTGDWKLDERVQDRHAFVIPAATPPGEYTVQVVVYSAQTGIPASVAAPENVRGQALDLGPLSITRSAVPVAAPALSHPLRIQWNEIALAGIDPVPTELYPGDTLALTLYWQARFQPTRNVKANLVVLDASGQPRAAASFRPANPQLPTRAWQAGDFWRDQVRLTVDARAAPGPANVYLFLTDEESGRPLEPATTAPTRAYSIPSAAAAPSQTVSLVDLAELEVAERAHRFDLPAPQNPLTANLANKVRLLGYDLASPTLQPSTPCRLTLYWQTLEPMAERYTVFVHVLDAAGNLIAQRDTEPQDGQAPTTSWLAREVIVDPYSISIPATLAPGTYTLQVGLYQAGTGQRLALVDSQTDSITLARLPTAAP